MADFIEQSKIDEILYKADIVSVVDSYVPLKKVGSRYKAPCPFHREKDPSFIVTPEKNIFHCFGCGAGGNAIHFIMRIENLPFVEAIRLLADRYHVELAHTANKEVIARNNLQKRIYEINKEAANFYYTRAKASARALAYLQKRGLSPEAMKEFGIGYADEKWDSLTNRFIKKYTKTDLIKAGLVMKSSKSDRLYDRFRDRLLFPIQDISGRVLGFGGRALDDENMPKYLNTSETPVYVKGKHLYNLNRAKFACKEAGYLLLTEGYMDAVSLAAGGIKNTIASLGTALTPLQASLIKQYTQAVYLAYDNDEAGIAAALKNAQIIDEKDIEAKIIVWDDCKDPDEYIRKHGKEKLLALLPGALDYYQYRLYRLKKSFAENSAENKTKYARRALSVLAGVTDAIRLEAYLDTVSQASSVAKGILKEQLQRYRQQGARSARFKLSSPSEAKQGSLVAQENLLNILASDSGAYTRHKRRIDSLAFKPGILEDTLQHIIQCYSEEKIFRISEYISLLKNQNDVEYLSEILLRPLPKSDIIGFIDIIEIENTYDKIAEKTKLCDEALKRNDAIEANEHLQKINALKKSVEQIKGGTIHYEKNS